MATTAFGKLASIDGTVNKAEFQESNIDEVGNALDNPIIRRVKNYGQLLQLVQHVHNRIEALEAAGKKVLIDRNTVKRMMDPFMNADLFSTNDIAVEFFKDIMTSRRYTFVLKDKHNGAELFKTTVNIEE